MAVTLGSRAGMFYSLVWGGGGPYCGPHGKNNSNGIDVNRRVIGCNLIHLSALKEVDKHGPLGLLMGFTSDWLGVFFIICDFVLRVIYKTPQLD